MLLELSEHCAAPKKARLEMITAFKKSVEEWRKQESISLEPLVLEATGMLDGKTREAAIEEANRPPADVTYDQWVTPDDLLSEAVAPVPTTPSRKRKRGVGLGTLSSTHDPPQSTSTTAVPPKDRDPDWDEINEIEINLPSSLPKAIRTHTVLEHAVSVETELRKCQAKEHLDNLRAHLITSFGVFGVSKGVHGQILSTRAKSAVHRKSRAVNAAADAYRRSRSALVALGMSAQDKEFRVLTADDVKAFKMFSADEELQSMRKDLGQSKKAPSWLWERWDFINSSGDPKFRAYFEEGAY